MPRNRTIPDEALLDAALDVVRASGPAALTFAALAARTGLAASTLVQRFGTKAALLRAALSLAWDRLDELTAAADGAAPVDVDGAIELLVRLTGQYDAHNFADQLLVLREDLRDPVLRDRGRSWISTLRTAIDRRLPPGDDVGGVVVATWQGTLTVWGFARDAPLDVVVREALEVLFVGLGIRREATP